MYLSIHWDTHVARRKFAERKTNILDKVAKPIGLLQNILAPRLPSTIYSHILFPCLGMHIIYLPHINMSVPTKRKKKENV